MRCCQNKTSFSWSYRDSSKRSLENNVISRRGKRKIHTLEMSGHVQRAKGDPEAQRKSSLLDCTWLENENGSFKLEALNFLMPFREPGSSLYAYSYFFSFSYFFFFSFFLLLIHSFFFLWDFYLGNPVHRLWTFFHSFFKKNSPLWTLKLHRTYLLPHA
jgi:hypothetical protein